MRFHLSLLLAVAFGLAGCGHGAGCGSGRGTTPASAARSGACEPVAELAVDLSRIDDFRDSLGNQAPPIVYQILAEVFDVPVETARDGRVLERLGLDREGTLRAVVCSLDASGHARVEALRVLVPGGPDDVGHGRTESIRRLAMQDEAPWIAVRILVPVTRPEVFLSTVLDDRARANLLEVDGVEGASEVFVRPGGGAVLALSTRDDAIVVDLRLDPFVGVRRLDDEAARAAARRALAGRGSLASAPAPSFDPGNDLARLDVVPAALAELNFLYGLGRTLEAVESIDPGSRDAIVTAGAFESSRSFELAGDASGPFFEKLVFRLGEDLGASLRAEARDASILPPGEAFRASTSIAVARAGLVFEASPRFPNAFVLPGDRSSSSRPDGASARSGFDLALAEAGGLARLYAAPFAAIALLRSFLAEPTRRSEREEAGAVLAPFERLAIADADGRRTAVIALVAEGHDAKEAACGFFLDSRPCLARLAAERPLTVDEETWVLLHEVRGRKVVIVGRSETLVRSVASRVSLVDGGAAVHATMGGPGFEAMELRELLPGFEGLLEARVVRDGASLVFEVQRVRAGR